MKHITILLLCGLISGCSAANTFFDDHENFVNARNSEVGKNFKKVLSSAHYYDYWEGGEHYFNHKKYGVRTLGGEQKEYSFKSGMCEWALVVESAANTVSSWRFVSDREHCTHKQFYEGAW